MDDPGFTLITLFTGFALILGDTIWLMAGLGVSSVATGSSLLSHVKARRLVTEVQNIAGFAENVATLVGDILDLALAAVPDASGIADLVGDAIGIGSDFLRFCTASDGSAAFTVPWPWLWLSLDLPSCSGISL